MSKSSEAVKNWRDRTKARIVESMGGKCCVCGYNHCHDSLALHHLDPKEKDFNFGRTRANCASWNKLVIELRKCIMLCHNCHAELHEGLIVIDNPIAFNEKYATYNNITRSEK